MDREATERKFGVGIDAETHREILRLSQELGMSHKTIVKRAIRLFGDVYRHAADAPVMEVRNG